MLPDLRRIAAGTSRFTEQPWFEAVLWKGMYSGENTAQEGTVCLRPSSLMRSLT
jgi:hypothetical protein